MSRIADLISAELQKPQRVSSIDDLLEMPHLPYKYEPLTDPVTEIRLIRLLHTPDLICAGICTFPIAKAPCYIALSYTWGAEDVGEDILLAPVRLEMAEVTKTSLSSKTAPHKRGNVLEGIEMPFRKLSVRKNLSYFLHTARERSMTTSRWSWIDAICIAQCTRKRSPGAQYGQDILKCIHNHYLVGS